MLIFNTVKAAQAVNISKILLLYCTIADSCCIIFRLFCFLWCDGLFGSLQARPATQRGLCSHQFPQDPRKTGRSGFSPWQKLFPQKFLCPGSECPNHLHRPHWLHGSWSLALQEGYAHMEDVGESSSQKMREFH